MTMHAIAYGDPWDGISLVGPIEPNTAEVDEFIDRDLRNLNWWFVELKSIEEAREETASWVR